MTSPDGEPRYELFVPASDPATPGCATGQIPLIVHEPLACDEALSVMGVDCTQ